MKINYHSDLFIFLSLSYLKITNGLVESTGLNLRTDVLLYYDYFLELPAFDQRTI